MADVNANIGVNIDTSAALAQLKDLQRQISQFHTSIAKSSETAALAQRDLQRNFLSSVNAIGSFSAELRNVKTTSESFTSSLEKNKFSMREYFRYAGASTKTFGKLFKSEYDTIGKVAEDRVKKLQTQYIKMGRDASGAMKAIAVIPNELDMGNFATQTQMAAQKQALFNQLMKQGSTNLLNFGKNTQWAGRQLMVGFTLPLMAVGSAASQSFMKMEAQALKFKKVYGDLFTPQAETQQALADVQALASEFTKYGIAVADTVGLAADAAAAGFKGLDLQRQTTEATRLSVLGQIDSQQALQTTISLQNAFGTSSADLADSINFLNAVENQTVLSLDDITTAIPKVAPVIKQLGGNVKDLAFFLTAMKEGGVNASEGANALKSGLASLINPSTKARAMLQGLGIDINGIVEKNKGDLKATVVGFAQALDTLAPLQRARAIEQMFGKFQFARLSALFQNVTKDGTQAARVLDLAGSSVQELSSLSEKELGITSSSAMNKFKKSVEDLKAAIVPVGQAFLEAVTPVLEFVSKIANKFAGLSDGTKKAITLMITVIGGLGPVLLMTFGLLANGVANIIKLFLTLRTGYQKLTGQSQNLGEQTQYMTSEQLDAAAAAHSLNQAHATLTQQFTVEAAELNKLITAYNSAAAAGARFAAINPGMMRTPKLPKFADGTAGVIAGPGTGRSDSILARVSNGEAIIPAASVNKYPDVVTGLVAGNIPGFADGRGIKGFKNATVYLQEALNTAMGGSGQGAAMSDVLGSLKQSGGAAASPLLAVIANDIKKGLNDPNNYGEYSKVGDTLIHAAINALESSGKTFVKDLDLEQIVVPAMKDAAKGLSVAGIEIKDALNRSIEQIRTVAPIGVSSGAAGGEGRTNLPGSYRATGKTAQEFAMKKNRNVFERQTVLSQSKGTKNIFKMRDINSDKYVTATMAHIMPSINASVQEIESRISKYVPNAAKRLEKVGSQAGQRIGKSAVEGTAIGAKTASASKETIKVGEDIDRGLEVGMNKRKKNVKSQAEQLGATAVNGTRTGARRAAKRPQGPANIGPVIPAGAQELPLISRPAVPKQTVAGRLRGGVGKVGRLGGGVGVLGASMALGAMPDFAGKGLVQSTMTGASMGMLFGPWGAAAGSAIGLVTSALTTLMSKEREHEATVKATFTASSDLIKMFGDTALDTSLKITNITDSSKNLKQAFGNLSPEIQGMVDSIKALPEDNPIAKFVKNISSSKSDLRSVTGSIRSQVTSAIATGGLDPKNAEKYVQVLLAAANRTKDFGAVWQSVSRDVIDAQTATSASLDKLNSLVKQSGASWYENLNAAAIAAHGYKEFTTIQKAFADQMLNIFSITSNGSLSFDQMSQRINGVNTSAVNAQVGVIALSAAINNSGNADAIARLGKIKDIYRLAGAEAEISAGKIMLANIALQTTTPEAIADWAKKNGKATSRVPSYLVTGDQAFATQLEDYISDPNGLKKSYGEAQKVLQEIQGTGTGTGTSTGAGIDVLSKQAKLTIARLQKELDLLKTKRDTISDTNDELKRQYDYQQKLMQLQQDATQAKISGNYIGAAIIEQQKSFQASEFNKETASLDLNKKITDLENRISGLQAGARVTNAETALNKAKSKMAMGGLIKGPGTGTSDSIAARFAKGGLPQLRVSNGEYIVKAASVKTYGIGFMDAINNQQIGTSSSSTSTGSTVYNIDMTINGGNSNPSEIADQVIRRLKVESSKNNKSNAVRM